MASTVELMHLCRLCLVKEQVNVPIFEDQDEDSQIFMKIVTCLPVKINKDDKLPKKICGGCSYKLDLFYQFCNSTTNAEKQLLQWFNKVGFDDADNVDSQPEASKDIVDEAQADSISTETQSYILQQQQLPYGPVEFFQDDFDDSQPASGASESELVEESAVKKRKRATKNVSNKKSKTVVTTKTDASDDDDDDEDDDDVNDPNVMTFEDSKFSISCDRDVEEAGPSGIGKPDTPCGENVCDVCAKVFSVPCMLRIHMRRHFKEYTYNCDKCDFGTFRRDVLRRHEEVVHNGMRFICKVCGKKFTSKYSQIAHEKMHHRQILDCEKFKCEICNKVFVHKKTLVHHMKIHSGNNKFVCDVCGKTVASADSLKHHLMVHSGSKPYTCPVCGKRFNKKQLCTIHERTHGKSKPYSCTICHSNFTQRSSLVVHTRRFHTSIRPFTCNVCNKSFATKSALTVHKKRHIVTCDIENIDSKKYSLVKTKRKKQQVSLNHVNIIDNPRTKYKCADCNERFQDYQILQSHKEVCLNKNDDEEEEEDKDDHKASPTNTITSSEAATTVVTSPTDESNNQDADFDQNKSYLCKCGKNFYKTCMYIAHTKLCRVYAMAKNTDHFQCKNCHRFIYSLQFHNHTCAPAPKWNCHDCDENFKSFNELVQHYKDYKHSMTCGTCLKECTSYGSLAAHKMSCNPKFAAKITKAVTSTTTTTTTTTNTTGATLSTTQSSCKTVKVQQATQIPAETKTTTSNKTKINSTGKTKTCKICNVILPSDEKLKKHTCVAPSTAATTTTTKCDLCSVRLPPEALISHIESHFSIVQVKNVTGSTSTEMKAQESPAEPKASDNNNVELMLSELNKIISDTKNLKCFKCTICNKIETTEKKLQEHLEQHITVHQKPNHDHSAHPPTTTTKVVKPSEILPKTVDVTTKNSTNQIPLQRMIPLMNNQNPPKLFLIMTPTGGTSSVTPVYTTMTNLNLMTQSLSTFAIQPQLNLNTTHTTAQMPIRMQITPSSVKQPIANSISNFVISDVTSGPAAQSMIEQQSPAIAVPPVEGAVSSGAPAIGDSIDAAAVSNNIDDDTATKNVDETIDDGSTENAIDVSSNPNYKPKIFVKPLSQLLKSPVKTLVNEALSSESQKQNVDGSQVKKIIDTDTGTVIKKNVAEAEKTVTNVVLAEPGKLEAIGSASSVKTIIEVVSPSTSMLPNISLVKTKGVKKFFKCSMCNILQRKSYQLKQHQKKYNCRVCPYYCCKQAMMDKHYIDVHNYKNRCALCDMQFDTIKDQKLHKRKVHWCSLCGRCFADLELHEKAYTCKSCQFTACNNVILDKHYKKMHCVTMRCTPCNEVFYSHTTFTDHKDAIHYCKKCKTYKMDLNIHQTFCKGVPIRPSPPVLNTPQVILNSPTIAVKNFQEAMYSQSNFGLESCDLQVRQQQQQYMLCVKQEGEYNLLDSAVDQLSDPDLLNLLATEDCTSILQNIESNENFERLISNDVDDGNLNFLDANYCENILKEECYFSEVRPYACEVCNKRFKQRHEVNAHKRSHSNPSFQCDICSKMFVHKSHLTSHRKKHLCEFSEFCKDCNKGFVTKSAYLKHVKVHHEKVSHICDICGHRLSTMSALNEHKTTHDPNYGKERSHVCDICGKSYLTARNLKTHLKTHLQLSSYVCNICGKSLSSKKILETHVKMHIGEKDFVCEFCTKSFAAKEYLVSHRRIHTGDKPFKCHLCEKAFTQRTTLTVHLRCHTGERPYKCHCGKAFITKNHLTNHYKTHDLPNLDFSYEFAEQKIITQELYSDEAKSVLVSVVALEEKAEKETKKLSSSDVGKKVTAKSRKTRETPRTKRKTRSVKKDEDFEYVPGDGDSSSKTEEDEPIHCDTCDTIFKNHLTFGLHSLIHNADDKYSCHMCNYKSSSKYNFEMHIKAHQGKTGYKCEICNKAFTISTHAVEHKNFHTGEKPFQCEICGKHFMFSWFLTSHRRSQHWEIMTGKPLVKYDCTICNKHYTSATGLRRHKISKHNYQGIDASVLCDICGKSLSSKEKLKFHRRIHTGYKPYSCQMCSKSFTRKEQLKEHERVHTGEKPFICKFCGKGFTQRSPLRIHERTHTGERPYICRLCGKGFISKGVMDTHMKNCEGGQHSTFMQ
ncbi:PREDICTED: uncharacterized protein LOC108569298 [Nicrophorus vespilloides]|uniref:Uncharacterized protein LOC108569298 n=1 Tax=Nicrophorus vespilloides TaxID=110193 RepID=A0ABM1NHJ2_NICVS|nr:PREDICTED: uncharacterized protein LOC108569298 [Nicrophorus vespilloides]